MGLISSKMDAETIKVWADGLSDMSARQLANGMRKAKDFTDYMTLPAFRELCRFKPEDFGIPHVRGAFDLIYKTQLGKFGDLGHPVVYRAMQECGSYDLQTLSSKDAFRRFEYYYDSVSKRFMAGEPMDMPIAEAIPAKVERPKTEQEIELSNQNRERIFKELRELVGLS